MPLLGLINDKFEKDNYLIKILAEELKVEESEIIGFDLGLYEIEKGSIIGINEEFISAGRLDDLWMVYAGMKALLDSGINNSTNVLVCVDNEEIGVAQLKGQTQPYY